MICQNHEILSHFSSKLMLGSQRNRAKSVPNLTNYRDVPAVVCDGSGVAYSVGTLLGKGGFAKCYLAYADNQHFALKVISRDSIKKASCVDKVRKEILTHFALRHPNIVTLYTTFEDADNIYMLLEYCPNRTLAEFVESSPGRCIDEPAAIIILKQLLKAVKYLHSECKILHRDIKPGNILLSRENVVKLADFGFSCSIAEIERRKMHTICGTPNYVSVEVLDRMGHSIYSESWSIACTFYCMLFGRPPFHSDSQELTYSRIRKCSYTYPCNFDVSSMAKDFIARILIRNRYDRLIIDEMLVHPLLSNVHRRYFHVNATNSNRNINRYNTNKSVGNLTPVGHHDAHVSPIEAKRPVSKNALLDSGLGSGGDLCGVAPININHVVNNTKYNISNTIGAASNTTADGFDVKSVISKYIRVLTKCIDSFDPVYFSPIDMDLCNSFVAKWVDYTNKFGFGATLKDGSRLLLLNDESTISISSSNGHFAYRRYKFESDDCVVEWSSEQQIQNPAVSEKFHFLSFLRSYMDRELYSFVAIGQNTADYSDDKNNSSPSTSSLTTSDTVYNTHDFNNNNTNTYIKSPSKIMSHDSRCLEFIDDYTQHDHRRNRVVSTPLRRAASTTATRRITSTSTQLIDAWKSPTALLMLLSDGTCQVNFSESRYKILICCELASTSNICPPTNNSELNQRFRVFIVTPEHAVFGYEAMVSYDLNRVEPPEEFIYQLSAFKRTLQQYIASYFRTPNANNIVGSSDPMDNCNNNAETRVNGTKNRTVPALHAETNGNKFTGNIATRLRSATNC